MTNVHPVHGRLLDCAHACYVPDLHDGLDNANDVSVD